MGKLKYLVIHCTATPEGREVSSADIRKWHTSPVAQGGRGWKQVGYTDLFHLNGGVERLVENNEDAQVDQWEVTNGAKGYNSVSRHIVYAGGVEKDGKTPKDTRTEEQKDALERYVKAFHSSFPDVRIVGHNELAAKACPSFDVQDVILDEFEAEGNLRGYQLPIMPDKRKKPDKLQRIEAVSPLWERGFVFYNEKLKESPDMQTGIEQTLALERGSRIHDDAPDADEGAIWMLQRNSRQESFQPVFGKRPTAKNIW